MTGGVVQAAAGCGKTTDLACRYLRFLADGVPAERAIAVTFTRKAAAELADRVATALRACLGDPAARHALGDAWPAYRAAAPADPALLREALAALPDAPIGTTDAFVQALLSEYALDARVPLPGGDPGGVPLDLPIRPGRGTAGVRERAARRILDPADGDVPPEIVDLSRYFSLDDLLSGITRRTGADDLPLARFRDLLGPFARALAAVLARNELFTPADPFPAVAAWLAAGGTAEPPLDIVAWFRATTQRTARQRGLRPAVDRIRVDLGVGTFTVADLEKALRYPFDDPARVDLADRLRAAREALRLRAVRDGLIAAASAGDLGHDELAEAAIALAEGPPPGLLHRFGGLLVDEVQDADPRQLRLYRAIAALPGVAGRAWFVGDARQSIYLFRGAEPVGLARLAAEAPGGPALDVNFRSHAALVSAHIALFDRVAPMLAGAGLAPLAGLAGVTAAPGTAKHALDPAFHDPPDPVWLVRGDGPHIDGDDANRRALCQFLARLDAAWNGEDRPDTAAVLCTTWRAAREACDLVRRWSGRADAARIEGSANLLDGRVAQDVVALIAALHDREDDLAWLAVWKHPMVGLSDDALARLRTSLPRAPRFGAVVRLDALGPAFRPDDQLAFLRAAPALRRAIACVGSGSIAAAIDELADTLGWRAILAASPDADEDCAALEVLLDQVRAHDADGADADTLLARMRGELEAPAVHLDACDRVVTCTTVFQAKGLAWDHVLVWSAGRRAGVTDDHREPEPLWADVDGRRVRMVGLRFDPEGGLSPFKDPVGRLLSRVHQRRREEEVVRILYVAVTRARRSVTIGLPDRPPHGDAAKILLDGWRRAKFDGCGVAVVRAAPAPAAGRAESGWAESTGEPGLPDPLPAVRWLERAPSDIHTWTPGPERHRMADAVAARAALGGIHPGGSRLDPPHIDGWRAADWGTLAHAWMAAWEFAGPPTADRVRAWLDVERPGAPATVVAWLVAISLRMASSPLWPMLTDPRSRLHFELPMVGVWPEARVVLGGRMDLLVVRKRGVWVVDFKVGEHSPTGLHDVIEAGGLLQYAPQLEAYRTALLAMGKPVEGLALWYLRTGASVTWG